MLFVIFGATILIVLASVVLMTQGHRFKYTMRELSVEPAKSEVDTDGLSIVGFWYDSTSDKEGLYLANQSDLLEIFYCPKDGGPGEKSLIYRSPFPVEAYQTFAVDNCMLLLEMYKYADGKMNFDITRIGYDKDFKNVEKVFSDQCDKFPYLCVTKLYNKEPFFKADSVTAQLEERVIVNYDNNDKSYLVLLSKYFGPGNENIIVNTGTYEYFEGGNLASGKRIIFCGGYGDYIYYQVVYNKILDPHPEVANFESHGTPILYRYHVGTEAVENIMTMDKLALHINANNKILLVSEYDYHTPLIDSGKIISLDDRNKYFIIPGIESGADIKESRFISENQLVFYTPKMLYFADLEKSVIYTYKLDGVTSIQLNNTGVSFTKPKPGHDNTMLYYTMSYESIFGK